MASSYKTFMKIIRKWPIDKSKKDRDLGKYLRKSIKTIFTQGEITPIDEAQCSKRLEALGRISCNTHFNKYKREISSTATGLNSEQCKQVLSTDFLEYLEYEDKGIVNKIFSKVKPAEV